jgi:hypothetical protein
MDLVLDPIVGTWSNGLAGAKKVVVVIPEARIAEEVLKHAPLLLAY